MLQQRKVKRKAVANNEIKPIVVANIGENWGRCKTRIYATNGLSRSLLSTDHKDPIMITIKTSVKKCDKKM